MDTIIQEMTTEILNRLNTPFRKIRIEQKDDTTWRINIESEEPSLLIGRNGENIYALQSILRTIIWKNQDTQTENLNIIVDVDDYRKRQEENIIKLAERKVETLQKSGEMQSLPPMSPYFRRLVHLHLAEKYKNILTQSVGEGDSRYLTIQPKQNA